MKQPMMSKMMWVGLMVMVTLTVAKVRITKADLIVAKQMLKPQVPASNGWPVRTVVQRQSTDGYGAALPPQGHSIAPAGAPPMAPMQPMMMMQPQYDSQPILPPSAPSNSYGSAPAPNPQVSSYGSALTPMSYGPPPPPPPQQTGYGVPSAYGPAPPVYYEEEEEPDCEKESKFSKLKGKMQSAVKGSVDKQKERLDAIKEMVKQAAEVQKDMLRSFKEQLKEMKKKQPEPEEPAVYYPAPAYGSAPAPTYGSAPAPVYSVPAPAPPAPVYSSMAPMPVPYPVMQQPSYISTPTAPATGSSYGSALAQPSY